jgi:hypothetical protein
MAFMVLATGVGLFGVLSGYLANFFLAPSSTDEPATESAASQPAAAVAVAGSSSDHADLLRLVEGLEADIAALRARLGPRPDPADGT